MTKFRKTVIPLLAQVKGFGATRMVVDQHGNNANVLRIGYFSKNGLAKKTRENVQHAHDHHQILAHRISICRIIWSELFTPSGHDQQNE